MEHDGSISRGDFLAGNHNNHDFNPHLFDEFLKVAVPNHEKTISLGAAAAGRWSRIKACNATNPEFHYNLKVREYFLPRRKGQLTFPVL